MPVWSWRRQPMCCANSSPRPYWEFLYSDRQQSNLSQQEGFMSQAIWVGAVAYDPKVVTIWEGMRRYFVEEAMLPVEVILFQSYEAHRQALLSPPTTPTP